VYLTWSTVTLDGFNISRPRDIDKKWNNFGLCKRVDLIEKQPVRRYSNVGVALKISQQHRAIAAHIDAMRCSDARSDAGGGHGVLNDRRTN